MDIIAGSEQLHEGPGVFEILTLNEWLRAFERWRAGYDAFLKAASSIGKGGFTDDFDRRQHEHYAGLFFQSGQWHAILLMLIEVEDVSEPERERYLGEMDSFLEELRGRMERG